MGAALRRVLRVLLVVSMLGALGATIGAAEVAAASSLPATSATPGVPTSTIKATFPHYVTYCVSNYAPNSTVTVVNQRNGATGTIHTDSTGAGCTNIPIERACGSTVSQTIVATGTDALGKPASSSVTYIAPPDPSLCPSASPTPTPTSTCVATQAILSVYVVPQGTEVRGHACGFTPGEIVFLYLHSTPVFMGSTTADADGIAAKLVNIPNCISPGEHVFEFIGQTSGNVASADFTVTKAPGCSSSAGAGSGGASVTPISANNGGGSGGGTLAFTGADIATMVLVALVLLALGIVATVAVRRRRATPTA